MTRRPFPHCAMAVALLVVFGAPCAPARGQDNAGGTAISKQSTPAIDYRERPRYPYDPQRLKRRPILDGKIADNEWDPLYTIGDGPVKGTVYVNWDDDFLYVACRTDQPAWFVFDLDCSADGWLRGADNLEVTVSPPTQDGSSAVSARILDAAGNKDAPVWNDHAVDVHAIQFVQKSASGSWVLEMAIPKGVAGLNPRAGATLSCRADLLPASAVPAPTAPYEPHLLVDITLVEALTIAAPGLAPRLTLDDSKLIPGQNLRATLELMNQTEQEVRIRSLSWRGGSGADNLLREERDPNVAPVKALKSTKYHYSSALPQTAVPGFYQVTAAAELDNGKTVQSTISFSIVEPFALRIFSEPDPINVLGPTVVKVSVEITSAVPGYARGDVEIEVPAGWDVKGKRRKEFYVAREDSSVRAPFFVTLPSTTPAGDDTVNATVYWRGKTWTTHATFRVNRSTEVTPSTGAPKKP